MVLFALILPSAAQSQTYPSHLLKRIHHQRNRTWHYQGLIGTARTPYHYWAERKCGNRSCRYNVLQIWRKRKHHWKYLYYHIGTAVTYNSSKFAGLLCIHTGIKNGVVVGSGEGAWNDDTGNGYYGGLQMDYSFETKYGPEFYSRYGNANNWPPLDQLIAGYRAVQSRGYNPWPTTARDCGLL